MNIYELVIMYESNRNQNDGGASRHIFQAQNDDVAKTYALGDIVQSKYSQYPGYFIRLTRINNFPIYDERGCITSQNEEHLFRHYFP